MSDLSAIPYKFVIFNGMFISVDTIILTFTAVTTEGWNSSPPYNSYSQLTVVYEMSHQIGSHSWQCCGVRRGSFSFSLSFSLGILDSIVRRMSDGPWCICVLGRDFFSSNNFRQGRKLSLLELCNCLHLYKWMKHVICE